MSLAVIASLAVAGYVLREGLITDALGRLGRTPPPAELGEAPDPKDRILTVEGSVGDGESLYDIFKRYDLGMDDLSRMKASSKSVHNLNRLSLGRAYKIAYDGGRSVRSFSYCIDDDSVLNITRKGDSFCAERAMVPYEKRLGEVAGVIRDNLVSSVDSLALALELSDVFAWDIDFNTDLRQGDAFKAVVEEYWLDGRLKKYGSVLSAEFNNNGEVFHAYRYGPEGEEGYFDRDGKSLKRAFLKAPLSFRRISSGFTTKRYHPILKIYRPHLAVDYAAAEGTPVSALGDGTVQFAGYSGGYGNMVAIRHPNGYTTYYGHLSRIEKGVREGGKVRQGQVIGAVGSTGLSTGPHLDFRMKRDGKFINPLKLKAPKNASLTRAQMADFKLLRDQMDARLGSIVPKAAGGDKASEKSRT